MSKKMVLSIVMNTAVAASMVVTGAYQYGQQKVEAALETFDAEQRHCLTQNIFFEARNQSEEGQKAVAWVTFNRMEHSKYPNTICDVVWQPRQFSWTHDGKADRPSNNVVEQRAWAKAQEVAAEALIEYVTNQTDPTKGSIMYHADYVKPYWAVQYAMVDQIDSHIFYK